MRPESTSRPTLVSSDAREVDRNSVFDAFWDLQRALHKMFCAPRLVELDGNATALDLRALKR